MGTTVVAIRHAKPGADGELSDEGRAVQQQMAERLVKERIKADAILTSPLIRAVQTAEILQQALGGQITPLNALGDEFNAEEILEAIKADATTVLVGHEPNLPVLVNELVGHEVLTGMSKSSAAIISFLNSAIWGHGTLEEYLVPGE